MQLNLFEFEEKDLEQIYASEKYIVTKSNSHILEYLINTNGWDLSIGIGNIVLLRGEAFSGKTHLANIFVKKHGGIIINNTNAHINHTILCEPTSHVAIDGIENFSEKEIFHLFNYLRLTKKYALFTSSNLDILNDIKLPDLQSRLSAVVSFELNCIDEILIKGIIIKILSDSNLRLPRKYLDYISQNIDRSFAAVRKFSLSIKQLVQGKDQKINLSRIKELIASK